MLCDFLFSSSIFFLLHDPLSSAFFLHTDIDVRMASLSIIITIIVTIMVAVVVVVAVIQLAAAAALYDRH